MKAILEKAIYALSLIIPAAIWAYVEGLRKGRQERAALQRKFLNETLKEELKKNAEIIEREFGDNTDVVRKAIGSDRKRDNG